MYLPPAFAEDDLTRLHDFIAQYSFGLLVSQAEGRPFATHLPFLLDRRAGPRGELIGHLARANPQWQTAAGQEVLAVFSGPHAYISPSWYEADRVVPTWNYVAVHAYGPFTLIEDPAALTGLLHDFVRTYEEAMPRPWRLDGPEEFVKRMAAQVVGFRIPIGRLEGKWKLNQNHPEERRRKVVRALKERGDENAREIAALMEESLRRPDEEGSKGRGGEVP